jgi:hypothetical protein
MLLPMTPGTKVGPSVVTGVTGVTGKMRVVAPDVVRDVANL